MTAPRLAFMGSSEFALASLKKLHLANYRIVAVYSQPPKPAGRGQELRPTPVHEFAESHMIPVFTPKSLRKAEAQEQFKMLALDIAIVAAYGLILPKEILDAPRLGCLNIHGSLLPRWRGAAPIQRAILAGDHKTGVGLMQMDEGLDTGAVYAEAELAIREQNAGELHDQLAELGANLLIEKLPQILAGQMKAVPQSADGVTYAEKIDKEEAAIDFTKDADYVARHIRAFSPWPGPYFTHKDERIKIWKAEADMAQSLKPGEIAANPLRIGCGKGVLLPLTLQRPGKNKLGAEEFARGFDFDETL